MKWIGTIPAVGVCTSCDREFKVSLASLRRLFDAQESLRVQFAEHRCKRENAKQKSFGLMRGYYAAYYVGLKRKTAGSGKP